jgi:hypothetical protein
MLTMRSGYASATICQGVEEQYEFAWRLKELDWIRAPARREIDRNACATLTLMRQIPTRTRRSWDLDMCDRDEALEQWRR